MREKRQKALTAYEREKALPLMAEWLSGRVGSGRRADSGMIIAAMRQRGVVIDGVAVRRLINHIRIRCIVPCLVSDSMGYYVATSPEDVDRCIISLQGRMDAIQALLDALREQRDHFFTNKRQRYDHSTLDLGLWGGD